MQKLNEVINELNTLKEKINAAKNSNTNRTTET